jgi:hypothetical protein
MLYFKIAASTKQCLGVLSSSKEDKYMKMIQEMKKGQMKSFPLNLNGKFSLLCK